jgi:hypothetical protein
MPSVVLQVLKPAMLARHMYGSESMLLYWASRFLIRDEAEP